MSDRRSVRAELERKRIQLAQMRQERERRSRMMQDESTNLSNLDRQERLEDADAILHSLGLSASLSRASTAPSNVSSLDRSGSNLQAQSPDVGSSSTLVSQQAITPQLLSQTTSLNENSTQSNLKTAVPLQVVHVNQINIPPKERVYYTKSTQTSMSASVSAQDDPSAQGIDAPQQKSYYGKQSSIPPALQSATGQQPPQSPSVSLSSTNTQVAGVNQLTLEWDDEFPGMFRLDLEN